MPFGLENFILVSVNLQLSYCPSYRSTSSQTSKISGLRLCNKTSLQFLEISTKANPKYDQIVEPLE